MKTATELQRMVQDELKWEPSLHAGEIGVGVTEGVVTLHGHVGSYSEKWTAEKAVKRVAGVRGVANDLEVRLPYDATRDDTDLAQAALNVMRWSTTVPDDRIQVTVANGWITLEGEVDWFFQKRAAYNAVRDLTGIRGVIDQIRVKPRASTVLVKDKIEDAFERNARVDAKYVQVAVSGDQVTLSGHVRSWAEADDAEWAAWSAPGVSEVRNQLVVEEEADVLG